MKSLPYYFGFLALFLGFKVGIAHRSSQVPFLPIQVGEIVGPFPTSSGNVFGKSLDGGGSFYH